MMHFSIVAFPYGVFAVAQPKPGPVSINARIVAERDKADPNSEALMALVEQANAAAELAGLLREATDHLYLLAKDERDDTAVNIVGWDDANRVVSESRELLARVAP